MLVSRHIAYTHLMDSLVVDVVVQAMSIVPLDTQRGYKNYTVNLVTETDNSKKKRRKIVTPSHERRGLLHRMVQKERPYSHCYTFSKGTVSGKREKKS